MIGDFQSFVDTGFNDKDDMDELERDNTRRNSAEDFATEVTVINNSTTSFLERTASVPFSRLSSQDLSLALGGLDCVNYIVNRTKKDVLNQSVNFFYNSILVYPFENLPQ